MPGILEAILTRLKGWTTSVVRAAIMSDSEDDTWMNPFHGITDQASANKYVEEAMAEATPEELESLGRAVLGDKYDEWRRLKDLAELGPARVTGGEAPQADPKKAAADAAAARATTDVDSSGK